MSLSKHDSKGQGDPAAMEGQAGTTSAGPEDETRQIQRVALYAFLLNLALGAMKAVLAVFSGSLAVTASAIDSGTDSVASLALFGGLKLSTRKTSTFPLGLYKIENVISVVIALFIFFAGYEIARNILSPSAQAPDISLSIIAWFIGGTIATLLFGQYAIYVGRRTGSPTLKAEGKHRQTDVLSSVVVLAAVVLNYFEVHFELFGLSIDQLTAGLVLIFIAQAGWELLSDGMRVLLDASVDSQTLSQVRNIIESEPMVTEVESLVGRNAGRYRFLQAKIALRTDDLQKAHQISDRIEAKIHQQIPHVERVSIHYEPHAPEFRRVALPLTNTSGELSGHFGESPYFALVLLRRSDQQISKQEIIENPHRTVQKGKGIRVAEWLVEQKVDEVVVKEEIKHKGPGYVFSNAGIKTHVVNLDYLDQALEWVRSQTL